MLSTEIGLAEGNKSEALPFILLLIYLLNTSEIIGENEFCLM